MTMQDASKINISGPLALFLDFDGTLVEIVDRPDLTIVPDELKALLADLQKRLSGALAVISGRPIAELDRLLSPLRLPAAGVHGLELRGNNGEITALAKTVISDDARRQVQKLAAVDPGLIMEDKGHSLSMHYRLAPGLEQQVHDTMQRITATLGPEFILQHGKMVVELKPGGIHKGTAIERFASQPPFAGRRAVFFGDDVTDEDAFDAVNRLDGYSIKVGDQSIQTSAQYTLPDVTAVHRWLGSVSES